MVQIDKVKAICSYFADNVEELYVTKLMKLFYYADFIAYAKSGSSITNDTYFKLPYGPVPSFIKNEIDNVAVAPVFGIGISQLADIIKLEEKDFGRGKKGSLVKKIKNPGLECLSQFEIDIVSKVAKRFNKITAKELSDRTHNEPPYKLTSDNSEIQYDLAYELDYSDIA